MHQGTSQQRTRAPIESRLAENQGAQTKSRTSPNRAMAKKQTLPGYNRAAQCDRKHWVLFALPLSSTMLQRGAGKARELGNLGANRTGSRKMRNREGRDATGGHGGKARVTVGLEGRTRGSVRPTVALGSCNVIGRERWGVRCQCLPPPNPRLAALLRKEHGPAAPQPSGKWRPTGARHNAFSRLQGKSEFGCLKASIGLSWVQWTGERHRSAWEASMVPSVRRRLMYTTRSKRAGRAPRRDRYIPRLMIDGASCGRQGAREEHWPRTSPPSGPDHGE